MDKRIDDAVACAQITRRHARTFTLASRFLPAEKRRGAFAVYAFCREADDIVDGGGHSTEAAARALDAHRRQMDAALDGAPGGPLFRELSWAVHRFGIPRDVLHELLDGVALDLAPRRYATWNELSSYCEGVAASVGAMCTHVFGVVSGGDTRARAIRYARTLGVAMQLTNILRDVGEDRARGRCYLPAEDLRAFGLRIDDVMTSDTLAGDVRWIAYARHEVARARALYAAALPGIALLSPDSQACARACAVGYESILGAIEANGYDTFSRRAHVGLLGRAALMWRLIRGGAVSADVARDEPRIHWRERVFHRAEEMGSCA
jgi:phytoene synthase